MRVYCSRSLRTNVWNYSEYAQKVRLIKSNFGIRDHEWPCPGYSSYPTRLLSVVRDKVTLWMCICLSLGGWGGGRGNQIFRLQWSNKNNNGNKTFFPSRLSNPATISPDQPPRTCVIFDTNSYFVIQRENKCFNYSKFKSPPILNILQLQKRFCCSTTTSSIFRDGRCGHYSSRFSLWQRAKTLDFAFQIWAVHHSFYISFCFGYAMDVLKRSRFIFIPIPLEVVCNVIIDV